MMNHIKFEVECCSDCPFWRIMYCEVASKETGVLDFEMTKNHNHEVSKLCPLKDCRVTVGLKKMKNYRATVD